MIEGFTVSFPLDTPTNLVTEVVELAASDPSVKEAKEREMKGALEMILAWVQLASPAAAAAEVVVGVVQKVVELIQGRGMQGVVLTLSDGTKIEVDKASAGDVERLIRAATAIS